MTETPETLYDRVLKHVLAQHAEEVWHSIEYHTERAHEPPNVLEFLKRMEKVLERNEIDAAHLQRLQSFLRDFILHYKGRDFIWNTVGPYLDDMYEMFLMDHDVGLRCGHMVLRLAESGYRCTSYLNAVKCLSEVSEFGERVRIEGKLASLLDPKNEQFIEPSFKSDVFTHWLYADTPEPLPPYSWGGKAMMRALRTGARRESYDNDIRMAGKLGMEDAQGRRAAYTHGYPDLYIDMGSGDGGKGVERTRHVLGAGRDVVYVPVDFSEDAVRESCMHANGVFSQIAERFDRRKRPRFEVIGVCDRIENLPENDRVRDILRHHPVVMHMFYGTTIANYDPPESALMLDSVMPHGGYAEVGLQLYSGDDSGTIDAFGNDDARAVSSAGLVLLGFSPSQIDSMDYHAEVVKRKYREFGCFDIGKVPVARTFFVATRPMEAGLVALRGGERVCATERYMYEDWQFRNVYTHGGRFNILDKRQIGNDAIYPMVKP